MDWERLLEGAKKVGPNVAYHGKLPLERALESGNTRVAIELIRMGAELSGVRLSKYTLGLGENEETLELIVALVERLQGEDRYDDLVGQVTDLGVELGGRYLQALKPIKHKTLPIALAAARWGSLEAFKALEEWGVLEAALEKAVLAELVSHWRSFGSLGKDCKRIDLMRYLLERGASASGLLDKVVGLPEEEALEAIRLLIEYGADPQEKYDGRHITFRARHVQVLKLFLELGVPFEYSESSLRMLCQIDPARAIAEALRARETFEVYTQRNPVSVVFSEIVQKEKDEKLALERLKLFEGVELNKRDSRLKGVYLGDFEGGLGKLLGVASWLLERGYLLRGYWAELAVRLGAREKDLEFLLDGLEAESLKDNIAAIWKNLRSTIGKNLKLLAWLSQKTGLVEGSNMLLILPYYLEAGGNPNARVLDRLPGGNKDAILHLVKTPQLARMLLKRGADPNLKNAKGETPLHKAMPDWELAEVLLEFGADPMAKDKYGNTPMDIAEDCARLKTGNWKSYRRFAEKLEKHPAYRQAMMLKSLSEL